MFQLIGTFMILACITGFTLIAISLFRRRRARRLTQPPEEFVLLRGPGETQRQEIEKLSERLDGCIELWTPLSILILGVPFLILAVWPTANPIALVTCCVVLFAVAACQVISRMTAILEERANRRLGYRGERHVAELLQPLAANGWHIFHDVPVLHSDGKKENIDHLLVGLFGAIVVETKTRSIPKEETGWKNEVHFDGQCLHWPFYGSDDKPAKQVKRCAEWLQNWLQAQCAVQVPVFQMIAIPGWYVDTANLYEPRVTSGRAVTSAVGSILLGKKEVLNSKEVKRIQLRLDELCRDVRD